MRDNSAFPALPSKSIPRPPAPSGTAGSYLAAATRRGGEAVARDVSSYSKMLLDPFARENACRYPDESIVPTALTHLVSSTTYTVDTTGTVYAYLNWKVTEYASTGVPTISGPGALGGSVSSGDYGVPQASWLALNAIDRTLAMSIRVRHVALADNTFMPSGTIYFLQIQQNELFVPGALGVDTEPEAIQAVLAGKGFSMTMNELAKTDGIKIPFLPQGPMSFVYSDKNSIPAASAGTVGGTAAATVVSANPVLYVVGFGLRKTTELRFDFAHHIEYIPTYSAAGLVATKVELPSAEARQGIATAAAAVQGTLAGSTTAAEVRAVVAPASTSALGTLATNLGREALGMIPGGRAMASAASALGSVLGAPPWLTSALKSMG